MLWPKPNPLLPDPTTPRLKSNTTHFNCSQTTRSAGATTIALRKNATGLAPDAVIDLVRVQRLGVVWVWPCAQGTGQNGRGVAVRLAGLSTAPACRRAHTGRQVSSAHSAHASEGSLSQP
jgi:hypothetical protein